jgi:hypothetical protein
MLRKCVYNNNDDNENDGDDDDDNENDDVNNECIYIHSLIWQHMWRINSTQHRT